MNSELWRRNQELSEAVDALFAASDKRIHELFNKIWEETMKERINGIPFNLRTEPRADMDTIRGNLLANIEARRNELARIDDIYLIRFGETALQQPQDVTDYEFELNLLDD